MAPINQINRLTKLPHLLNKKREARRESKKKKDEDTPPFPPEDKAFLKKSKLKNLENPQKKDGNPKSSDDNVGSNLDLTV